MEELLIVGTGALASLFAARFSAVGIRVTMLGTWSAGIEALQNRGVQLVDNDLNLNYQVWATNNPADCVGIRYAIVLVKSWQTERAARQLAECLPTEGLALTLQNGLGNREVLVDSLGAERVALGVTTYGATLLNPGRVRPGGEGVIALEEHPMLKKLLTVFQNAGFKTETTSNAASLIWSKLVINAAINPVTAILRIPNGDLLSRPTARVLMAGLAEETAAVAAAQGIRLNFPEAAAAAENVAERTSKNHASMYQDLLRGAPTEIDAICGAIVQAGETFGVPTPLNRTLWALVKAAAVSSPDRPELVPIPQSEPVPSSWLTQIPSVYTGHLISRE